MEYSIRNENKYDVFYQSVKDLAVQLNLSSNIDFEGISDYEIFTFERDYNIQFPISIRFFLKYFGKRINIKHSEMGLWLTLKNIEEATIIAIENEVSLYLKENKEIEDFIDDNLVTNVNDIVDIDNVIYISWDDFRSGLGFLDSSKENPEIYYLMEYKFFINEISMTFTNHIRFYLFSAIKVLLSNSNSIPSHFLNSENESWFNTYKKIFQNRLITHSALHKARMTFNVVVNELEIRENKILSINEFENMFIDFLKEDGYKI